MAGPAEELPHQNVMRKARHAAPGESHRKQVQSQQRCRELSTLSSAQSHSESVGYRIGSVCLHREGLAGSLHASHGLVCQRVLRDGPVEPGWN